MKSSTTRLTEEIVLKAISASEWDFGNSVLYDLCKKNPRHIEDPVIIAKIWLIGRSYATAIERRKNKNKFQGDDFYVKHVAPMIKRSKIDEWVKPLSSLGPVDENNMEVILTIHKKVTILFFEISGLEKRSLASKYLHFHFPSQYFIYDSRAVQGLSVISRNIGKPKNLRCNTDQADKEYRKLCGRCIYLRNYIKEKYGYYLNTRQIDKILLKL